MRKIIITTVLLAAFLGLQQLYAQSDNNILLYNNQATLFGDQGPAYDPISIVIPGTAMKAGIGSFIDNPASMALFDKSIAEFGLSFGDVSEEANYLGNTRTLDNDQFNFSNLGFLYSLPTSRGSLVFGGAYTKHTTFNRALAFRGRNENSTISDYFKTPNNSYGDIAWETYAIFPGEEFYETHNSLQWDESVFRVGFDSPEDYPGIHQQGEILQSGNGGEYSLFFATEFQRGLMVGASIGLLSGKLKYDRIFQEIDEFNDYNSDIIDVDGGTDIDNILLDDNLTSRFNGFRARVGLLYKATDNFNVGVSYTLPTKIFVDEEFDATINTTFDNDSNSRESTNSQFSYNVKYPGMVSIGAALEDLSGLSISLSAEYVNYSKTEIEFEESDLFEDELAENDFISEAYHSVWSYRAGLAYDMTPDFTVRGGYRFQPSRFKNGNDDRTAYSFGAGFRIGNGIRFEAAAQYTTWDEVSSVYDYGDYNYSPLPNNLPSVTYESETANRGVDSWQIFGTIRVDI